MEPSASHKSKAPAPSEGYRMTPQELRALQLVELELLQEVDRLCRKNGIEYRMTGGTVLGAIRHGGFIPWDDDADVSFTREEYEKFCAVCATDLDTTRFYFQDMNHTPGYRWGYGKLRRKDTLFVRIGQEHMPYEQGIFIDLFPMDYMPDNYFARCVVNFRCFLYRKILWSAVGKHTAKGIQKLIYRAMSKVPEQLVKSSFNQFIADRRKKTTGWIRTLLFPTPTKDYGFRSSEIIPTGDLEFENRVFRSFANPSDYLSFKYGDYMVLPPEDKRKTHPISKLKLPSGRL